MNLIRDIVAIATVLLFSGSLAPGFAQTRTTEWSQWTRAEDADYRYQLRWDLQNSRRVDAIYEVKNLLNTKWDGNARAAECSAGTGGFDKQILLQPKETKKFTFRTDNCGTKDQPSIRQPGLVRAKTL